MTAHAARSRTDAKSYFEITRSVTVSFAYLLPLLAIYEVGIWCTGIGLRNAAELSLKQFAGVLGIYAIWAQRLVLVGTLVVAIRLAHRDVPALRLYPLFLLEATLLALLLGPLVSLIVEGVGLRSDAVAVTTGERILLSIGAGVYEELVFRFLLLAGGFALLHRALSVPRPAAFAISLLVSALLFSAYHHAGPYGEPFRWVAFVFRAAAGLVLGLLFAARGLALCAYLHAFYDILCDLGTRGGETT